MNLNILKSPMMVSSKYPNGFPNPHLQAKSSEQENFNEELNRYLFRKQPHISQTPKDDPLAL